MHISDLYAKLKDSHKRLNVELASAKKENIRLTNDLTLATGIAKDLGILNQTLKKELKVLQKELKALATQKSPKKTKAKAKDASS